MSAILINNNLTSNRYCFCSEILDNLLYNGVEGVTLLDAGAIIKKIFGGTAPLPNRSAEKAERQAPKAGEWRRWALKASSGVRYVEGCPIRSRLGVRGNVVSPPARSPVGNAFWQILKTTESFFMHLYVDPLSSSNSVSCHIFGRVKAEVWGQLNTRMFMLALPHFSPA